MVVFDRHRNHPGLVAHDAAQLQSAISLHRQGLLVEAAAGYREILKLQPDHFDALQLFATIALQKKSYE